jgi:hypothetical protein
LAPKLSTASNTHFKEVTAQYNQIGFTEEERHAARVKAGLVPGAGAVAGAGSQVGQAAAGLEAEEVAQENDSGETQYQVVMQGKTTL